MSNTIRFRLNSLLIALGILIVPGLYAQQASAGGMTVSHRITGDRVEFTLTAPTQGWVGIGFNSRNSIVSSDLYLFHVVDGQTTGQDMYVKAAGDPRLDLDLGGTDDIQIVSGTEGQGKTRIVFSLPLSSTDKNDFKLAPEKELWLIMAYSTHDEFDHHSRMRRHVQYTL